MPDDSRVQLTQGLFRDGICHDEATLRPLTGADEILLAETEAVPAVRTTVLLVATLNAIGSIDPISKEHVRDLTIGDRERLLLALYRLSFGPLVDTVLDCSGCTERIELPLDLDVVLAGSAAPSGAPEHSFAIGPTTLRFRLPTGADHEHAARLVAADPARGARALRDACVIALTNVGGDMAAERMPDELQAALEEALRRLDPAAEITIAAACPACGARLVGTLDALSLLADQIGPTGSVLRDVDRIARAYYWSEAAILALPTARRRRYLALLDREAAA